MSGQVKVCGACGNFHKLPHLCHKLDSTTNHLLKVLQKGLGTFAPSPLLQRIFHEEFPEQICCVQSGGGVVVAARVNMSNAIDNAKDVIIVCDYNALI